MGSNQTVQDVLNKGYYPISEEELAPAGGVALTGAAGANAFLITATTDTGQIFLGTVGGATNGISLNSISQFFNGTGGQASYPPFPPLMIITSDPTLFSVTSADIAARVHVTYLAQIV